jgi:hypothetical protein
VTIHGQFFIKKKWKIKIKKDKQQNPQRVLNIDGGALGV